MLFRSSHLPGSWEVLERRGAMAEVIRTAGTGFLKFTGRLFAAFLSTVGVLSSCNPMAAPTYGVEVFGIQVFGETRVSADTTAISGIEVRLLTVDYLVEHDVCISGSSGAYELSTGPDFYPWPDSIRLIASDIDGELNGSFLEKDTVLCINGLEEEQDTLFIEMDIYLESAGI